jgi:hypothetical protein
MTDKTNETMEIPSAVKDCVRPLLELEEDGEVIYAGKYDEDHDAYQFLFPEGMATSYPIFILYHKEADVAYEVPHDDALEVLDVLYGDGNK